jgi:hypothetical protein
MWQCDWKHSNTHVMTSFFWFEIFNKCEKYIWKKNIWTLFFWRKKPLDLKKLKIMLWHFPIGTCHHLMSDPFGFLITNVILKMKKNHDNLFFTTTWWSIYKGTDASNHDLGVFEKLLMRSGAWAWFMWFGLVVQKFLNIEWFLHWKLK